MIGREKSTKSFVIQNLSLITSIAVYGKWLANCIWDDVHKTWLFIPMIIYIIIYLIKVNKYNKQYLKYILIFVIEYLFIIYFIV